MTYPKIWFLRHGQTEWNAEYRLQGQFDSPLTAQGRDDAARQAGLMAPVLASGPACFASPLRRAVDTADIVLGGAAYTTDPRLMEIDAGRWQGMLRADILAGHPDWAATDPTALEIYEAAEEGEGIDRFQSRIRAFMLDLAGPSVIVAHGLLGQVLRAEACGLDLCAAGRLPNRQGCVYVLENGVESVLEAAA